MARMEWLAAGLAALMLVTFASVGRAEDEQGKHFQQSVTLEGKQKYEEALAALDRITGAAREGYMVQLRRGWLLYLLGKHDDAVAAYGAAVKKEPGSVEARLGMMMPQMAARRWVDAEKTGLAALKLDAKNYLALSRLAYTYYNLTRFHEAEKYYKQVLALYPGDLEMRSGFGWSLFKQGKYEEAKSQFQRILAVSPTHEAARQGLQLCP